MFLTPLADHFTCFKHKLTSFWNKTFLSSSSKRFLI